jgi:hypothetical protein
VRHLGRAYEVLHSEKGITLRPYQARTKFCSTNRPMHFGLNCQMWVEVVPVKKHIPEPVQEPQQPVVAIYTNISGHINLVRKLEAI